MALIKAKKSIIVAADVPSIEQLKRLVAAVRGVNGISGFKIGFDLGLTGLAEVTQVIRSMFSEAVIIYDHQKAGNDIPDMGKNFAKRMKASGVDAAILFPFAGPATQEEWTKVCLNQGLTVLTGGIMTHPQFLVGEGGYISDDAPERIFRQACKLGVRDFVVPGNKINWVLNLRKILVEEFGEGDFVLYAPGFITQQGDISECGQAAGGNWHAIVGSAIYNHERSDQMRESAIQLTKQIVA